MVCLPGKVIVITASQMFLLQSQLTFLLTLLVQYQADEKKEYKLGDNRLIQFQILQPNIT